MNIFFRRKILYYHCLFFVPLVGFLKISAESKNKKVRPSYTIEQLNTFPHGTFDRVEIENAVVELNKFGRTKWDNENGLILPPKKKFYAIFPKGKLLQTKDNCPLILDALRDPLITFYIICAAAPINRISYNFLGFFVYSNLQEPSGNTSQYKYDEIFDHYETPPTVLQAMRQAKPGQRFSARFVRFEDEWPMKIVILDLKPLP